MNAYAMFTYHRKDDNMLATCLHSLNDVSPRTQAVIVTDGVPQDVERKLTEQYRAQWIKVDRCKMAGRRATCKVEELASFGLNLRDGDWLLASDVDVVFKGDPMTPFVLYPGMDLGLTTRGYEHLFPINAGIFYVRISPQMRNWLTWHVQEVHHPVWPAYVHLRSQYHHERYGPDWSVGQDFLIANWYQRREVFKERQVNIVDVGPSYNYCPPTDVIGKEAFRQAVQALRNPDIQVIHLKSELKRLIYDDAWPNAQLIWPKGQMAWM